MDDTQNAQNAPVDPDAASEPSFASPEVAQNYEDGLIGRPEADVYDVLYATGFAGGCCAEPTRPCLAT